MLKVRIKFRKYGVMRFIGHLDVMRYFQKAIRRAEIPIAFTTGYSPHMIMSFAQPLGVGVTSDGEYFDIEITEPISSEKVLKKTKRSEKEVDIKPMIYKMTALDDGIYLYLATGSEQNLKPDLVAEAFLKFAGEDPEEIPVHIHRIDVYAKNPEAAEGQTEFITLEGLGKDIL